jgi:hypothetical protein
MNLFWAKPACFCPNQDKELWGVAVVQPERMDNLGDARTTVLAVQMVVIN